MKFLRTLITLAALAFASPATAQLPPINAVAGPTSSAELRRIITDENGTGTLLFGGADGNSLTNLNASALATGTVANARLPGLGSATINGVTCTLGSSCTITASAASVAVSVTDVLSGVANGILYNNGGKLGNLATGNNGLLVTSGSGVPSISTTLPNGLAMGTPASLTLTNATGLPNAGLINPSTTVNGQTCILGSTCTVTAAASTIVGGTTTLTGVTNANGPLVNIGGVATNIASANNAVYGTNGSGVPSLSSTLPNGLNLGTPAAGVISALTVTATGGTTSSSLQNRFGEYLSLVSDFGAVGNGVTYDDAALTAAFAKPNSPTIRVPAGVYRLPCGVYYTASSSVSFIGEGKGKSVFKFDAGCTVTNDIFAWDARSDVMIRDITIDVNTPAVPSVPHNVVVVYAYSGSVNSFVLHNTEILNAVDKFFMVGVAAAGGNTLSNFVASDNLITATAGLLQNQCIGMTTVNGSGNIDGFQVINNRCVGSGIQIDGKNGVVSGNDISAFKFGTGIFLAFDNPIVSPPTCSSVVVSNNVIHDSTTGVDSNNTAFGGIENSCVKSTLANNIIHSLGGAGIFNFASDTLITGNVIWDTGKNGSGGAGGVSDQSGIVVSYSAPLGAPYDAANVTVVGNKVWDPGTGWPKYGMYTFQPGTPVVSRSNDFRGSVQAIFSATGDISSDDGYIATRDALVGLGTSSLAWSSLDTKSYKNWSLQCRQLTPLNLGKIGVQFGRGATPTWLTAASYGNTQIYNDGTTTASVSSGADAAIWVGASNYDNTQGFPALFTMNFGDLGYIAGYRLSNYSGSYGAAGIGLVNTTGNGTWAGDSNPVDAIRVISDNGDFYGSCTLLGRP